MRRPGRLSRLFLCAFLQFGVLAGVPMRPEQIAELMQMLRQPTLAHVEPERSERDGPLPEPQAQSGGH